MILGEGFKKHGEVMPGIMAFVLIVTYSVLVIVSGSVELENLTKEDGIVEYAAVVCYLIASFLMFSMLRFRPAEPSGKRGFFDERQNLVFFLIGLLLIVFAGEEISWGQRILRFDTPDSLARINRQGETTLHNLNFWEALDPAGLEKHGISRFYSSVALYNYFWFVLFLVIPPLSKLWPEADSFFNKAGIPVTKALYGFLFLTNFIVFELLEATNIELRPIGEIKETNFALLYLAACVSIKYNRSYLTVTKNSQPVNL